MVKHKYKIRVEIETDQGVDGKSTLCIETTDEHNTAEKRPVNECIAMTMAGIAKGIINSGRIVCPSTFAETSQAFADEMLEPLQSDYDDERLRLQNQ